jgi:hypothetical protein
MNDLKALMAAGAPPAADPRFVVVVMARIERRRFARELATTLGLGAFAVVLLALVAPSLEITWRESFAPYASNFAIVLVLMIGTLAAPYFFPARD